MLCIPFAASSCSVGRLVIRAIGVDRVDWAAQRDFTDSIIDLEFQRTAFCVVESQCSGDSTSVGDLLSMRIQAFRQEALVLVGFGGYFQQLSSCLLVFNTVVPELHHPPSRELVLRSSGYQFFVALGSASARYTAKTTQ